MKTLEPLASAVIPPTSAPKAVPMPFTPDPDEVPGQLHDAPIEPAPPTTRRTVKGKLNFCGKSQPLPVIDPWE